MLSSHKAIRSRSIAIRNERVQNKIHTYWINRTPIYTSECGVIVLGGTPSYTCNLCVGRSLFRIGDFNYNNCSACAHNIRVRTLEAAGHKPLVVFLTVRPIDRSVRGTYRAGYVLSTDRSAPTWTRVCTHANASCWKVLPERNRTSFRQASQILVSIFCAIANDLRSPMLIACTIVKKGPSECEHNNLLSVFGSARVVLLISDYMFSFIRFSNKVCQNRQTMPNRTSQVSRARNAKTSAVAWMK